MAKSVSEAGSVPLKMDSLAFKEYQKQHFIEAEKQRFNWQTTNPLIKAVETRVLSEPGLGHCPASD